MTHRIHIKPIMLFLWNLDSNQQSEAGKSTQSRELIDSKLLTSETPISSVIWKSLPLGFMKQFSVYQMTTTRSLKWTTHVN